MKTPQKGRNSHPQPRPGKEKENVSFATRNQDIYILTESILFDEVEGLPNLLDIEKSDDESDSETKNPLNEEETPVAPATAEEQHPGKECEAGIGGSYPPFKSQMKIWSWPY